MTGVCSTRNVDLVRSIGADEVIDYTREDFTRSGHFYDVIFDCIGDQPLSACRRVMTSRGIYVVVGGPDGRWLGGLTRSLEAVAFSAFVTQRMVMFLAGPRKEDLAILRDLLEVGKITPVIDKRYSLNEVPEAVRYLEAGHARGKVVIGVD